MISDTQNNYLAKQKESHFKALETFVNKREYP